MHANCFPCWFSMRDWWSSVTSCSVSLLSVKGSEGQRGPAGARVSLLPVTVYLLQFSELDICEHLNHLFLSSDICITCSSNLFFKFYISRVTLETEEHLERRFEINQWLAPIELSHVISSIQRTEGCSCSWWTAGHGALHSSGFDYVTRAINSHRDYVQIGLAQVFMARSWMFHAVI